jgi:hypothetical protein
VKSEKLQKRIEKKRNKKKVKEIHHAKRTLFKYIISNFHQRKKNIDLNRLPLDFKEIQKVIKTILQQKDMDSVNRILSLFDTMEKTVKEVDISTFKNKSIIKDVSKLMRVLHVQQNPKNPMKYSLYHMFRKRDPKVKYTTDVNEIIPECLSSYYLLVKCLFDYYIKEQKKEEGIIDEEKDKNDEEKKSEKLEEEIDEKDKIDGEYQLIEEKVGQNAELINKAFSRILNNNILDNNKKNEEKVKNKNYEELETDLNNLKENKIDEENNNKNKNDIYKIKPSDFFKMTMNILQ